MTGEILAMVLNTIHNVRHYQRLMERIRQAIEENRYDAFRSQFLDEQEMGRGPIPGNDHFQSGP